MWGGEVMIEWRGKEWLGMNSTDTMSALCEVVNIAGEEEVGVEGVLNLHSNSLGMNDECKWNV